MSWREILISALLGLLVNECCDVSPWLARAIVRWSVRYRYAADPVRAEIRTEELVALLDARPGKLLKLTTALGFAGGAIAARGPRHTVDLLRRAPTPVGAAVLGAGLIATWVSLYANDVALPEAYTVPLAVVALLIGALAARRADASSWRCFSVALAAAFLPSLVMAFTAGSSSVRPLALCVVAAAVLVAGARRRLQAPVVAGFLVLPVAGLILLAQLLPASVFTAVLLTGLGSICILSGAASERRRMVHRLLKDQRAEATRERVTTVGNSPRGTG